MLDRKDLNTMKIVLKNSEKAELNRIARNNNLDFWEAKKLIEEYMTDNFDDYLDDLENIESDHQTQEEADAERYVDDVRNNS